MTSAPEANLEADGSANRTYLVFGEDGKTLIYAGSDPGTWEVVCRRLDAQSAGYVSGYQFVGRRRYDLRAYFTAPPAERFVEARRRRDLFDFGWHPSVSAAPGCADA